MPYSIGAEARQVELDKPIFPWLSHAFRAAVDCGVLALNYVLGKEQQSQKAVIEAVSDPSYPAHAVKVNGRIVAFEDAGKQKLAVEIFSNPNFGKDNFQGRELARKADDLLNTGEKYK